MALKGLYVAIVTVAVLFGNHNCVAETVRSLGKPLLQTVSLTVKPLNESHTAYVGLFQGPTDTEVIFKGKTVDACLGRDDVFEAFMVNDNRDFDRGITVKSNSTGEQVEMYPNLNFNLRTETDFIENSCDVGIEKVVSGNRTEFTATVRNCGNKDYPSLAFIAHISYKSGNPFQLESHDLDSNKTIYDAEFHKYFYSYYTSDEDGIYHAIWDFPAMKADGYNFHSFGFAIDISNLHKFGDTMTAMYGDIVTVVRSWYFEIMNAGK